MDQQDFQKACELMAGRVWKNSSAGLCVGKKNSITTLPSKLQGFVSRQMARRVAVRWRIVSSSALTSRRKKIG